MDAAAELGRNPISKHQIQPEYVCMEMSRLTRDGTAEPASRDLILRHERGQGNIRFSRSADHVQDWQPYPVDPYSCYMCDHTYPVAFPKRFTRGCNSAFFVGSCSVSLLVATPHNFIAAHQVEVCTHSLSDCLFFFTTVAMRTAAAVVPTNTAYCE